MYATRCRNRKQSILEESKGTVIGTEYKFHFFPGFWMGKGECIRAEGGIPRGA